MTIDCPFCKTRLNKAKVHHFTIGGNDGEQAVTRKAVLKQCPLFPSENYRAFCANVSEHREKTDKEARLVELNCMYKSCFPTEDD